MSQSQSDETRITQLEIQLAHLQRHVEQLDSVVTDLGRLADRQSRTITTLETQLRDLRDKPRDIAVDLVDEKPPHY